MNIAICDGSALHLIEVSKKVKELFERFNEFGKISFAYREFTKPDEILAAHEKAMFDVVFLDVDMPGMNGFQVADFMYKSNPRIKIIYVTSHGKYIKESINHEVFSFVTKGCDEDYEEAIRKVLREYNDAHKKVKFEIIPDDGLDMSSIKYFTSNRNYVIAHTTNGDVKLRATLAEIEKDYKENFFFRIDRCTIVNFYYVYNIIDRDVNMHDGTVLRASRERAKELRKLHYLYTFDRDSIFDDDLLHFSPDLDDKPLSADEMRRELKTEDIKTPKRRGKWWWVS